MTFENGCSAEISKVDGHKDPKGFSFDFFWENGRSTELYEVDRNRDPRDPRGF